MYIPYSTIIGQGKYWQKIYIKGMVRKYLANLNVNIKQYALI